MLESAQKVALEPSLAKARRPLGADCGGVADVGLDVGLDVAAGDGARGVPIVSARSHQCATPCWGFAKRLRAECDGRLEVPSLLGAGADEADQAPQA